MSGVIFDKFSEIKPKEYSYNISLCSELHWDTYYRHKFNDVKGRTYYATILGCQNFPTAYIAFDKEYITKTTLIEIQKYKDERFNYGYDYFNRNGNFTQEFTYYEKRNDKIILGWDYGHCEDYGITNTDGKKHTTESIIDDIRQTIKEMDDFLFTSTLNKKGLEKLKCEFFDECVKALSKEPLLHKIIVLDDLLKRIQEGAYVATPTYYNKGKDPTFAKDGIKTKLEDGIYYKGFKVGDL